MSPARCGTTNLLRRDCPPKAWHRDSHCDDPAIIVMMMLTTWDSDPPPIMRIAPTPVRVAIAHPKKVCSRFYQYKAPYKASPSTWSQYKLSQYMTLPLLPVQGPFKRYQPQANPAPAAPL